MMPPKKRNHDALNVVDLTGDDDTNAASAPKRHASGSRSHLSQPRGPSWRTPAQHHSSHGSGHVYGSPARSNGQTAPTPTQGSQDLDFEDPIDMTQANDPERELYGNLGRIYQPGIKRETSQLTSMQTPRSLAFGTIMDLPRPASLSTSIESRQIQ